MFTQRKDYLIPLISCCITYAAAMTVLVSALANAGNIPMRKTLGRIVCPAALESTEGIGQCASIPAWQGWPETIPLSNAAVINLIQVTKVLKQAKSLKQGE